MTREEQLQFGVYGMKSAKKHKVLSELEDTAQKVSRHAESTLQLTFCKWMKKSYPDIPFCRHEREKARSYGSQNLMQVYNNLDGLPDMEVFALSTWSIEQGAEYDSINNCYIIVSEAPDISTIKVGLYIEFKKPGEKWLTKDGKIKPQYEHQYKCHQFLWSIGRPAYFCNDMEDAKNIVIKYLSGSPLAKQEY